VAHVEAHVVPERVGLSSQAARPLVLVATFALIPVLVIESDVEFRGLADVRLRCQLGHLARVATELAAVLIVATRRKAALRAHGSTLRAWC
jgi:hypothetical protein